MSMARNTDCQRHGNSNSKFAPVHTALDIFLKRYCPMPEVWDLRYNYSIRQVEYACDILFKSESSKAKVQKRKGPKALV